MSDQYPDGLTRNHFVGVGPGGLFPGSEYRHYTTPEDVDNIFNNLNGTPRMLVHFHGGLIDVEEGLKLAAEVQKQFSDVTFPVSFVWQTGLLETIIENLRLIAHEKRFYGKLTYFVGKALHRFSNIEPLEFNEHSLSGIKPDFDLIEKLSRGLLGMVEAELNSIKFSLKEFPHVIDGIISDLEQDMEIVDILVEEVASTPLLNASFKRSIASQKGNAKNIKATLASSIGEITERIIYRYMLKRDHTFQPTVVEEVLRQFYLDDFGAWVWGGMKTKSEEMWYPNEPPVSMDSHAGTYFLQKLASYQAENPDFIVDLVGHSAGSLCICHQLAMIAKSSMGLKIRNIIFLAPGAGSDLFYNELLDKPDRYESFRMFTMNENYELADPTMYPFYHASILFFVSGCLDGSPLGDAPISGLERHSSGIYPYNRGIFEECHDLLYREYADRLVLSKTAPDAPIGKQTQAYYHNDFNVDPETVSSVRYLCGPTPQD